MDIATIILFLIVIVSVFIVLGIEIKILALDSEANKYNYYSKMDTTEIILTVVFSILPFASAFIWGVYEARKHK